MKLPPYSAHEEQVMRRLYPHMRAADVARAYVDADRAMRAQAAPAAVAGPSETVKFVDESTADPVEKARRYLKAMGDPRMNSAYFFDDGYPRREISQGALATLAVLEQLAAAPQTDRQPAVQQWNDLIGKVTHADADGLLVWRDEVDFAIPTPQADSQPAKVELFNPLEGGNLETELQMAAVIALRDSQPAPVAQGDAEDAARVIDAARAAMDESYEGGNAGDIAVPSNLAAALSLALDEYDAARPGQGRRTRP